MRVSLVLRSTLARHGADITLVEILVVIAILGLLTGMVAVAVIPTFAKAKVDTTRTNIGTTMDLLKQYYLRKNKYPDTGTGLKALVPATRPESWSELVKLPNQIDQAGLRAAFAAVATACAHRD